MLNLVVTCVRGTEKALSHELTDLGAHNAKIEHGAVRVDAELAFIPRANIWLRTGHRVLLSIWSGRADTEASLIEQLSAIPFEERLDDKGTFVVDATLYRVPWTHKTFAAQRVKDVIVDRIRDKLGARPSVDKVNPSIRFTLAWRDGKAEVLIDTSGTPLHQRGYRRGVEGLAPLRETLAASILAIGHADVTRPFLDPCCGTGTLAIEQAWRALNRAPGRDSRFGFERWRDRPPELDRALTLARQEAKDVEKRTLEVPITLSDWHADAIASAEQCVFQAGLKGLLVPRRYDARLAPIPGDRPIIVANLPFGERAGGTDGKRLQLDGFYRTFGERFGSLAGARLILYTGYGDSERLMRIEARGVHTRRVRIDNGPLEAWMLRYDITDGSGGKVDAKTAAKKALSTPSESAN